MAMQITLPNHISSQLNDFAEALERYYDYLDIKVAEKRAKENEETFSLDEVRKELGL